MLTFFENVLKICFDFNLRGFSTKSKNHFHMIIKSFYTPIYIDINQGVVESLLEHVISKWKVTLRCLVDL